MKKLIAILLVAFMCLAILASCTPAETETPDESSTPESSEPQGNESNESGDDSSESEESSTPTESQYDIQAALDYLDTLYKKENIVTAADYQLVAQVMVGLDKYVVAWAVDSDKVNAVEGSPYWTIEVDEMSKETVNYKITATITAPDGTTGTVSYDRTVPEFIVTSFEDYMAAESGTIVTVAGIVVAINAKSVGNTRNHLFLADVDGKGGYYCYQLDQDPVEAGIEVGMTVAVTAPASPYSGMQETKGGDFVIVDKTIKTVDPVDLTDVFATADLKPYVGLAITLKGVTIGTQELGGTSEYLKFTLNGKESYIRTYVTDFPTTLKAEDKATIDAAHAANFGNTADVTGVLVLYSGNPYLIPMTTDCFSNYTTVTKTDAEKIASEKEALEIGASFSDDTVIELPSVGKYYDSISITWETDDTTGAAVIADGKLTLTVPEEATTVTVTATIKSGDITETKTFEIALSKAPVTIPEALEIPDGSNVLVSGTVVEINTAWSDQYNNISVTIADAEGNKLYLFRLATKVVVGDVITVKGQMATYNGARQVAAGATATIDEAAPIEVTLAEAVTLDDGVKVIVKGTVKEINTAWSDQYGNITVTIEDAEGNTLYIFRLATNVAVGDVVTITGKIGSYNGSKQIAAGATAVIENDEGGTTTPDTDVITTIEGALAGTVGAQVKLTGTVSEFYQGWNTQYNNCSPYIIDDAGNKIIVFRCKTQVNVGDVISVVGVLGAYNNVNQVAEGSTVTIVTAHVCSTFTDADCLNAAVCTVCGKANGEALGHNYVDGTCSACGATKPEGEIITASKTMAELITSEGWGTSTTNQSFTLDSNVTVKIDGGNNTGKAYNGDHIRIYATDSPAGTITISVAEGYELVSVKVTAQTGTYAFLCIGEDTTDICNTTTTVSGSSVVLNSVKNGENGKQVRVTAIEVVYQVAE